MVIKKLISIFLSHDNKSCNPDNLVVNYIAKIAINTFKILISQ